LFQDLNVASTLLFWTTKEWQVNSI
jgi:hypothetical protein